MGKAKVMVALKEVEQVETLVSLACQLSSGMDADLVALHVVEVPAATPLEAHDEALEHPGKEILSRAQSVAQRFSRELTTLFLQARDVNETIVGEAREQAAELLILGHHKPHSPTLGEKLFGTTVNYVAHHTPCRVIVQIPAPPQK